MSNRRKFYVPKIVAHFSPGKSIEKTPLGGLLLAEMMSLPVFRSFTVAKA
jgi:hypothetical protein